MCLWTNGAIEHVGTNEPCERAVGVMPRYWSRSLTSLHICALPTGLLEYCHRSSL